MPDSLQRSRIAAFWQAKQGGTGYPDEAAVKLCVLSAERGAEVGHGGAAAILAQHGSPAQHQGIMGNRQAGSVAGLQHSRWLPCLHSAGFVMNTAGPVQQDTRLCDPTRPHSVVQYRMSSHQ